MGRLTEVLKQKGFVIVVSLPRNDKDLAKAAFECGADAIKVHINVEHKASGTRFGSWSEEKETILDIIASVDCPVGLMPGATITPTYYELQEASDCGVDFIDIYDYDMPLWMLSLQKIGKMIAVGSNYTLNDVRSLEEIGADFIEASIVPSTSYRQPLTVKDLEIYYTMTQSTSKPILVPSQKKLEPADVPLFKEIGIKGLILGTISLGDSPQSFRERLPLFING
ncbi:MAG: hypothetical protein DKM50_03385 [Candidatus Margulisiibacteriota bacterium]|nr:MAG: hypothetical protein A2X43_09525 [Candidatus Margulisbacteria bacterium GWD2_39_127]OGI02871.1 MAG: hypothetical protein A2X42_02240 [Candidatus Margulisbacteria bacterium GWF2_38_17]OGI09652.1 MAG: hypothetical protein A2X41_04950 [Candidatus Margulisbacteria bacterium GWE2_39_32]PZM83022.1 MAG: hypothetical protein DKM50_03385 [Candidatus Margulisiibacteriota bacterium]HAR62182.1 hypothetical protein [Candidatus Margulisiibacteriota bacterium]